MNPRIRLRPFGKAFLPALLAAGGLFWPLPSQAGPLSFSKPKLLAVLPWAGPSRPGVPPTGADGLLVDGQGRLFLESGTDFTVYSAAGRYLRAFQAPGLTGKFFGFSGMEVRSDGGLLLLARLESPLEQSNKDNFEERSQPGARLFILDGGGKPLSEKEYLDPSQPHSRYLLHRGRVYSLHDDGTCLDLDAPAPAGDKALETFGRITRNPAAWMNHLEGLPVYRTADRIYHDLRGGVHVIRGARAFLMNRPFVEGLGPLGLRRGRIYYQVLCGQADFLPAVFVEDSRMRRYALLELVPSDGDLRATPGYSVFLDAKGDLYEGVARKEGYRIYRWTAPGE